MQALNMLPTSITDAWAASPVSLRVNFTHFYTLYFEPYRAGSLLERVAKSQNSSHSTSATKQSSW